MFQTQSDVSRQKSSQAETVLPEVVGEFGKLPGRGGDEDQQRIEKPAARASEATAG